MAENEQSIRSRRTRGLTAIGKHRVNTATLVSFGAIALVGWVCHLGTRGN